MGERTIYNYRLLVRIRKTSLWIIIYLFTLLFGMFISILQETLFIWETISILFLTYYAFYLLWGIWLLQLLGRKSNWKFRFIPWFNATPKTLVSYKEYLRYELIYLLLNWITSLWIVLWFSPIQNTFSYAFIFSLSMYRIYLLVRISLLKDKDIWIKYEHYGISVYKTAGT